MFLKFNWKAPGQKQLWLPLLNTYLHTKISQQLLVLNFPCSRLDYTFRFSFSDALQLHVRLSLRSWVRRPRTCKSPSCPLTMTLVNQIKSLSWTSQSSNMRACMFALWCRIFTSLHKDTMSSYNNVRKYQHRSMMWGDYSCVFDFHFLVHEHEWPERNHQI